MSGIEDYEALRERNIADRNLFLKQFLKEIKEDTEEIKKLENTRHSITEKKNKSSKLTNKHRSYINRSPIYQNRHINFEFRKKYNTRSKKRKLENDDYDDDGDDDIIVPKKSSSLKVMFSWSRPMQRDIDLLRFDFSDDDNNSESEDIHITKKKKIQKMTKSVYDPNNVPSPHEITQEMLNNIAVKASGKQYDAINGTCCHQCRQKTRDTKTICRSGECIGVRGQFCGPCLMGRYGESAIDALRDPHWSCPPCRDLCNCSICRTRNGQRPTGILAPLAKEEGYDSVKDYLQAIDCRD